MKDGNLKEESNIQEESSKQLELLLSETLEQEITDEEVATNWRTEIYGKDLIRKTLTLDKLSRNKFIKANTAMLEWINFVGIIKDNKSYEQIGYTKFEDWTSYHGVSKSTVNIWLKVQEVYCKKYRFTIEELSKYDIKKLNIILPLAEIEGVTKDKVVELLESITSMHE